MSTFCVVSMSQKYFFTELLKLLKLLSVPKTTRSSFEACIIRDILVNSNHPLISTYHLRKEALTKIAQTASLETYDPHKIIFQQRSYLTNCSFYTLQVVVALKKVISPLFCPFGFFKQK